MLRGRALEVERQLVARDGGPEPELEVALGGLQHVARLARARNVPVVAFAAIVEEEAAAALCERGIDVRTAGDGLQGAAAEYARAYERVT